MFKEVLKKYFPKKIQQFKEINYVQFCVLGPEGKKGGVFTTIPLIEKHCTPNMLESLVQTLDCIKDNIKGKVKTWISNSCYDIVINSIRWAREHETGKKLVIKDMATICLQTSYENMYTLYFAINNSIRAIDNYNNIIHKK